MSIKEYITQELDSLNKAELEQVADYLAFLKFQARMKSMPTLNEGQIAVLYAEFAEEDRVLAEEDMTEYADKVRKEDLS